MAVATGRKTSTKLISVNSNEGLVSEKRTTKEIQRAAINNVNQNSDSNDKHLPTSPNETVVIPLGPVSDKIRPCSGSSILKRNARPSSGHSVKFVETETIIAIQNSSTSFPISGNTSSNSDFNPSLMTINQQKPLELHGHTPNKSFHQTDIPPLNKDSRRSSKAQTCTTYKGIENDSISTKTDLVENEHKNDMSSRTQYSVDGNNFEENCKCNEHNYESLGVRKLSSSVDKAIFDTGNDIDNQQRKQKEDKKTAINSKAEYNDVSLNSLNEKGELKREEMEINKGNIDGLEEYNEDMPSISNENMPNISHQQAFGRTGERKNYTQRQVSFHRKKVIYNADLYLTDGDMKREGYYQAKGSEIERRHIRHKDLKEIMAGQNLSENEEVQFQDTTNLNECENTEIENRIPNVKTERPTQTKKRLHELYKELKRVREEIALMYSLEEAVKETIECDENSKADDNENKHQEISDSRKEVNDSEKAEEGRENQVVERIADNDSEKTEVEKENQVEERIAGKDSEKTKVEKENEVVERIADKDSEKTEVEKENQVEERIADKDSEKTKVEKENQVEERIADKDSEKTKVEKENQVEERIADKDSEKTKVEKENQVEERITDKDSEKTKVEKENQVEERIADKDSEKTNVEKENQVEERIADKDSEKTKVEKENQVEKRIADKDSEKTEVEKGMEGNARISIKGSENMEVEKEEEVKYGVSVKDPPKSKVEAEKDGTERISIKDSEKTEAEKETFDRMSVKDPIKIGAEKDMDGNERILVNEYGKKEVEKENEVIYRISANDSEKIEVREQKEGIEKISDNDSEKTEVEKEKKVNGRMSVTDSIKSEVEKRTEVVERISYKDSEKKETEVVECTSVITNAYETPTIRKENNLTNSADESEDKLHKQNTTEKRNEDRTGIVSKISSERNKESEDVAIKNMTNDTHIIKKIKEIDVQGDTEITQTPDEIEKVIQDKDSAENSEKSNVSDEEKGNVSIERVLTSNSDSIISNNVSDKNDRITTMNVAAGGCSQSNISDTNGVGSKRPEPSADNGKSDGMVGEAIVRGRTPPLLCGDSESNVIDVELDPLIEDGHNSQANDTAAKSTKPQIQENEFTIGSPDGNCTDEQFNDKDKMGTKNATEKMEGKYSAIIQNSSKDSKLCELPININESIKESVQIIGANASEKLSHQEDSVKNSREQDMSFTQEEDQDLHCEVNLDFAIEEDIVKENISKDLVDVDAIRENFSDSAMMMSPMKRGDDDYFDYDDDLSDNDSLADIPKVVNEKTHKATTNGANKIMKDIICNISGVEENRQFRKEFKSMTGEQEEMSCIVFCNPDDSYNVDVIRDINCINIDPLIVPCLVREFELLVSNITQLTTTMRAEDGKMKLNVRLPFMKSEMKYFHCPILRWLAPNRQWVEIPSVEYLYEDEEGCILPILEADIKQLGIFAIVAAVIKEHFVFGYNVHEVSSAVDRGTVLAGSYCPRFYTTETRADLMVIPIERSVIDDSKTPDVEDSSLMVSSSALVIVDLLNDPPQPLTLYILCSKPKSRPWTASMTSRIGTAESGYLSGSRIVSRAKSRESINHFLECWYDSDNYLVRMGGGCLGVKSMILQKKDLTKDDKIQVTLHEKHNKYLIVEMKKEARRPDVNTVVVNLLKTLKEHRIYVCVAQRRDDPRRIRVSCDLKVKVTTRMVRRLERDHYIRRSLILAKEGDIISVGVRGNITTIPNRKRIFRFYALNGFVADWEIQVVDLYCQRSLQQYCGFLQVFLCTCDSFEVASISGYEKYVKWKLLIEIPVTLPKDSSLYHYEKMSRSCINIFNKGPITVEFLRSFARLIGKEWYNLARGLRLEHVRIQSIAQQNKRCSLESLVYDLLLTWLKRSCHISDKAVLLASALRRSGRIDLAEETSDLDRSYKRDYYKIINDNRMDKAIYLASNSRAILKSWRYLGPFLELSQGDIDEIDKTESNEYQKCDKMLKLWRSREEPYQGPQKLNLLLRKAGFGYVADHIAVATRWRPKTSV